MQQHDALMAIVPVRNPASNFSRKILKHKCAVITDIRPVFGEQAAGVGRVREPDKPFPNYAIRR
jgi:hypothetical protein